MEERLTVNITIKAAIATTTALSLLALSPSARAEPTRTCQFNPDLGVPNPLGMRAYITITQEDGNTSFLYEQFPANILSAQVPATIATNRLLTFYKTGLEAARLLMLQNPDFYTELVGYPDPEGFAPVNAVLTCTP